MDTRLSTRLRTFVEAANLEKDPLLVSDGARLLAEVQQWEGKGEQLLQKAVALEHKATSLEGEGYRSLADRAHEVLLDEGGPMPYREIAAAIRARGFKHAREPKNPAKQLADSVWTAMHEDARFRKVGRGIFDLTERLQGSQ